MNRISYIIFRIFVFFIGLLPFKVLYKLSNLITFILNYIIKYRKKVIFNNLKNSFPSSSTETINRQVKEYYRSLSDLLLEGIKSYSLSKDELEKRFIFHDLEKLQDLLRVHNGLLILSSHYNNWEWGATLLHSVMPEPCVGFYKPLSHPYIDKYMFGKRTRFGSDFYPSQKSLRVVSSIKDKKPVIFLIADQSPSNTNNVEWVDFLNQKTPFLVGPEKIANKYNFPVLYMHIHQLKRGYYEARIIQLELNSKDAPKGSITKKYAAQLETIIQKEPTSWLWSHRRWKHSFHKNNS